MKFVAVLMLISICAFKEGNAVVASRHNKPVDVPTATTGNTLAQDLDEIARLIPTKAIQRLAIRYLLNDPQFQAFVRIINSHDGYLTYMRFRSQPEVMSFVTWVRSQIMLNGVELASGESNESLRLFNRTPFWSQNVFGWQGFVNEFHLYYPEESIRMHIETKAAQNNVFLQFIERLKSVKAAYDRVIATAEAKRLIDNLKANGIDAECMDSFLRKQFGWQHNYNATNGFQYRTL